MYRGCVLTMECKFLCAVAITMIKSFEFVTVDMKTVYNYHLDTVLS